MATSYFGAGVCWSWFCGSGDCASCPAADEFCGGAVAGAFDGSCATALSGKAPAPAKKNAANATAVESLILGKRVRREDRIFHLSATIYIKIAEGDLRLPDNTILHPVAQQLSPTRAALR